MNIGMILDKEFDNDLRVQNEVCALTRTGYNVFVLAVNYNNSFIKNDFCNAKIINIYESRRKIKILRGLTNTLFNYYPYFWAKKINRFVKKYNIDVLHVHDLYMFKSAFIAKRKFDKKVPIVGDLHENYVEGLKYYSFANRFPGKFLISIDKWLKAEKEWISQLDYGLTVIEEAVERYRKMGINTEFKVVSNYINIEEFNKYKTDTDILKQFKNSFNILYTGAFDLHRGLESVVEAVSLLKKTIPDIKLILVGAGQNLESLKQKSEDLMLTTNIHFAGWQKPDKLPSFISAADICLIPHLKTVHTDNTIPHKLFHYMFFEKPIIATNCDPLVRIIKQTDSGLIYESNNASELTEKIIELWKTPQKREAFGENGKKAVFEIYNWEKTSRQLIDLYRSIESEKING